MHHWVNHFFLGTHLIPFQIQINLQCINAILQFRYLSLMLFFLISGFPLSFLYHIFHPLAQFSVLVTQLFLEVSGLSFVFEDLILKLHSLIVSIQLHLLLGLLLDFQNLWIILVFLHFFFLRCPQLLAFGLQSFHLCLKIQHFSHLDLKLLDGLYMCCIVFLCFTHLLLMSLLVLLHLSFQIYDLLISEGKLRFKLFWGGLEIYPFCFHKLCLLFKLVNLGFHHGLFFFHELYAHDLLFGLASRLRNLVLESHDLFI